jgi:tetratricopeptide (TPR) repeat protein
MTHDEKRQELEKLLVVYRDVGAECDPQVQYHLGTAFFHKGFFAEARELLLAVTKCHPDHHQALNFLGMTELALGNFKAAIAASGMAVRLRPNYADFRNNFGEALMADNQIQAAIQELEEATHINLYYSDAYFNLGLARLLLLLNEPDPATYSDDMRIIADLMHRASLTYASFDAEAFADGIKALQGHDLIIAMNLFQRVRDEKRRRHRAEFASFYMKFVLHPDLINEKALADRIEYLQKELKKNPTYADLHIELAECLFEKSRLSWKSAVERMARAIDLNPSLKNIVRSADQSREIYNSLSSFVGGLKDRR